MSQRNAKNVRAGQLTQLKWKQEKVSRDKKLLWKVRAGSKNIRFSEMHQLLKAFDFRLLRIRGSHHIYTHPHVNELINIQNAGGKVKQYQVRQLLYIIDTYHLQLKEEKGREP